MEIGKKIIIVTFLFLLGLSASALVGTANAAGYCIDWISCGPQTPAIVHPGDQATFQINTHWIYSTFHTGDQAYITLEWIGGNPGIGYGFEPGVVSKDHTSSILHLSTRGFLGGTVAPGTYRFQVITEETDGTMYYSQLYSFVITPLQTITFIETGLPSDTSWEVAFNGVTKTSTTDTITYTGVRAGTYTWSVSTPIPGTTGIRYLTTSSGSLDVPTQTSQSITYTTQYELIIDANAGSTRPQEGGSYWYDAGSTVEIRAYQPEHLGDEIYNFVGWVGTGEGSFSGWASPVNIIMNGPINEVSFWRLAGDLCYFTIDKVTDPSGSSKEFTFTDGTGYSFTLTDTKTPWRSGFISPGTYTVTESAEVGWGLTDFIIYDSDGGSSVDIATGTATIDLDAGNIIAVKYKNTHLGSITVIKDTVPNDLQDFSFSIAGLGSFTLDDDDGVDGMDSVNSNSWSSGLIVPGDYTITENAQTGWVLQDIIIQNDDGNSVKDVSAGAAYLRLDYGENIVVTFSNRPARGYIKVQVNTYPSPTADDFTITPSFADSFTLGHGDGYWESGPILPGVYSFVETIPEGWFIYSSWDDDASAGTICDTSTGTFTVDLSDGETVIIAYYNHKMGKITVNLDAIPNDLEDFSFSVANYYSGESVGSFTLDDDDGVTGADSTNSNAWSSWLMPYEVYQVTEDPEGAWDLASITIIGSSSYATSSDITNRMATIDLSPYYGTEITATFQNTKIVSGNALTVNADPNAVTGATGSGSYTSGTEVTIAAPEYQEIIAGSSRYHFTGWISSGGGIFDSTSSPSTTFTMPESSTTVTALYETQYYLTVNDGGHGTAGGEGWYAASSNAQATLTPLTEAGTSGTQYVFTGWSGDASGSGSPSNNIYMNGPKTATATWKTQYQVTFVVNPTIGGSTNPTGVNLWEDAGTLSISATPNTGYSFDHWSTTDSISFTGSTSATTTATISGSGTITANYVSFIQTLATKTTTELSTDEPIGLGDVVYDAATVTALPLPVMYVGAGTPDNSEGDLAPSYPSGLHVDDLLLLYLTVRTPGLSAPGPTITGWSKLSTSSLNPVGQYVYFKWSDGSEIGTVTITTSLGDTRTAMICAFRNVVKSNTVLDFVEMGGSGGQGVGVSSVSGPSVSTTGDGRLAVSFVSADEAVDISSFTGETGGTWVEEAEYQYNPDGSHDLTMQLQTATIEASTGISGGSASISGTCNWVLAALALKPIPVIGTPTGSVTFYAKAPGGDWASYDTKSLTGGTATSDSFEPTSRGIWYFKAEYSGDTSFTGSTSGEEEEPIVVLAATTTTTELSPTSISLGATITDTASVTGTTTLPVLYVGAGIPDNSGSGGLTPSYPSGLQADDLILLHLTVRTPGAGAGFPTLPGWGLLSGNSANSLGQYVYFKWSTGTETGTVTITTTVGDTRTAVMYAFRNVVKSDYVLDFIEGGGGGQGIGVSSIDAPSITTTGDNRLAVSFVSVDAAIDIGSFTGESGGDWAEELEYQYDAGASDLTMQLQTATMEAAGTISGGSVGLGSNNNWLIRDLALKPRTIDPTGIVTFYVKAPSAASWTPYGTVKSLTGGIATSDSYTPTSIGTWYFMAKYLGDDYFAGSQSGDTAEPLTVGKATPTVVTDLSEDSITSGDSVTDTVTVSGLGGSYPDPTGSVDFQVSFNSGVWTTYDEEVLLVSGTASSEAYTPSTAGGYRFRAVYSGDSNYLGAQSGDNDELLTVAVGFEPATISGTKSKYGGYGLEGWTIKLYDSEGILYDSTTTDSDGHYSFSVNDPDAYVIKEVLNAGWTMTSPVTYVGDDENPTEVTGFTGVIVSSGDSITGKNFVNFQWPTITGIMTGALGPIEGWTIKLYDSEGSLYDSTTTDSNGDFSITVKTPGTYDVVEVLQAGWTMIYPDTVVGDDEASLNVKGYTVNVANSGVSYIENDFLNVRAYEVSFHVSGLDSDAGTNNILTVGFDTYTYADFPLDKILVYEGFPYSWSGPITVSETEQFVQTAGSDGTISGAGTIEASYQKQWKVSFSQTGVDLDAGSNTVLTVGTTDYAYSPLPSDVWVNDGTSFTWTSTVEGASSEQFMKTGESGLTTPISASGIASATYVKQWWLDVYGAPAGVVGGSFHITYTYGGTTYTDDPQVTDWVHWVDDAAQVDITDYDDPIVDGTTRYVFNSFSRTPPFYMNEAGHITLNYDTQYKQIFGIANLGSDAGSYLVLTVGSDTFAYANFPVEFWVDSGTSVTHIYEGTISTSDSGKQYALTTPTPSPASGYTVSSDNSITGTYKTQYQVTFVASPTIGGTINPTGVNVWKDSGTLVISATPKTGYSFDHWSTADSISFISSTSASTTATISGSGTITANFIDNINPISLAGALPTYETTSTFNVPYTASDEGSGIKNVQLWYRVSGSGSYTLYGAYTSSPISFTASSNGLYEFYTIATDNANNVEGTPETAEASTTVDLTDPSVVISAPASSGLWLTSSSVDFAGSATTGGSPLTAVEYQVDSGAWYSATGLSSWSFTTSSLTQSTHTVYVMATADSGRSYMASIIVNVDMVAPSGSITTPSDGAIESHGSFTVSGSASDAISGVQKVEISVDGDSYVAVTSGTTSWSYSALGLADGSHTFKIKVTDNAGWTHESTQISVTVDTVAPSTSASVTSGTSGTNGWHTSDVEVTIVPSDLDPSSGIATTSYSIDNVNWGYYTAPVSITVEGTTTIYYYSVDNAGNTQATQHLTVKIDKTNPTLSKDLSGTMGTNSWYTTDVQVTLTGNDAVSGVAKIEYKLNDAGWTTYTAPFSISTESENNLQHRVTDNAGRQYVLEEQTIKIDDSDPEVEIITPSDSAHFNVGIVDVAGGASDGAGVSKVEVDVDYGGYSLATDTSGDGSWATWSFTTDSLAVGTHKITAKATDVGGATATTSINVIVGAASLTFTSTAWSGQYSDPVTVSAKLIDLTTNEPIEGKTITFEIDTITKLAATDTTDSSGIAEVTLTLDRASGTYTITTTFAGDASYQESSDSHIFTLNKETAYIEYTGDSGEVTTSGSTITLRLAATLTQEADGSTGDLSLATIEFTIDGTTADEKSYSITVHDVPVNSAGQAAAYLEDVPIGAYSIDVQIESDNSYWEIDIDSNTIAVTPNNGEGYITGGGWIPSEQSINGKINFAFVVHYDKKGNPKGSFVAVFKSTDGFNYKIKSTSWAKSTLTFGTNDNGDPTACLTVTCVVQKIDRALGEVVGSWGNSKVTIDATDGDYVINNNGRLDKIAITVVNNSSTVLFQWGTRTNQIGIGNGNIAISVNKKK